MILKVGSTYSGAVDAFGYAVNHLGPGKYTLEWQIELERQAHLYLNKNHPHVKRYYFDQWFEQYGLQPVDIICGGEPCQPHSKAGNRLGQQDNRFRWPFMFAIIRAFRPSWVINENVAGSISNLVLDKKIADLEKIGYACQPYVIPAVATDAHHERERVFLIANTSASRRRKLVSHNYGECFESCGSAIKLGASGNAFLQFEERTGKSAILPMDDGIPDHIFRLGAAGNSIVSTIPIILLTAIYEIEKQLRS